jgi:alginate O-acetyltransferase complex protein AlgI
MQFNSLAYIAFFLALLLTVWLTPNKWRAALLTIGSYIFYYYLSARLAVLLLVLTAASYTLGILLARTADRRRDILLYAALSLSLGTLFYFKYFNFFSANLLALLHINPAKTHHVTLEAIGLSFIVFQITAYLLDVFYKTVEPEKSFVDYALFIAFFPKLLQGPLERASVLLPQIKQISAPDFARFKSGLLLILWGLFLKMVVADRIGEIYVNPAYANLGHTTSFAMLVAVLSYTLQLYFDFAGYTKVAIGTARCFGLNLSENFNTPLLATSCTDFWRRWHMTLSSWLRDYLFLPLQMRFRNYGIHGAALATLGTFSLAGLWHGASWGFIIFGLIHGLWLTTEQYWAHFLKKRKKLKGLANAPWTHYLKLTWTFSVVSFAFIFFRAPSVHSALQVLQSISGVGRDLFHDPRQALTTLSTALLRSDMEPYAQIGIFNAVVLLLAFAVIAATKRLSTPLSLEHLSPLSQWLIVESLLISIVMLGVLSGSGFAYFKF